MDGSGRPGNKLRPTLVRATKRDTESGRSAAVVSYGTTVLKLGKRDKIDLIIQNAEQLGRLGLPHATRFDLDTMQWVLWTEEFFAIPPHASSIVTGALNDSQIQRFLGRLQRREEAAQRARAVT